MGDTRLLAMGLFQFLRMLLLIQLSMHLLLFSLMVRAYEDLHCRHETHDLDATTATMKHLWSTPLLEWHNVVPESELSKFAQDVKDSYAAYLQEEEGKTSASSKSNNSTTTTTCHRNNGFFQYQQKYPVRSATMDLVWQVFLKAFDQYLIQAHIPPIDIGTSQLHWTKHCWAAVHHNGMFHEDHTHPRSALAGTLYLELPQNHNHKNNHANEPGALLLHDPRGPEPPFHRPYPIPPRVGTVVIFPSTLLHGVQPTDSEELRVSISCNHPGDWQRFTDSIPTER